MVAAGQKKKKTKPPSFIHYPRDRAQKLKKAWVEKAKIKSKWKAQKRKESRRTAPDGDDEEEEGEPEPEQDLEDGSDKSAPQESDEETEDPGITHTKEHPKHKRNDKSTEHSDPASLRSLFTEAYSKSSLHTYKSHPLKHKRRQKEDRTPQGLAAHGRANVSSGNSSTGGSAWRPRGQPNMKLRMNAMLEKIKRDYV